MNWRIRSIAVEKNQCLVSENHDNDAEVNYKFSPLNTQQAESCCLIKSTNPLDHIWYQVVRIFFASISLHRIHFQIDYFIPKWFLVTHHKLVLVPSMEEITCIISLVLCIPINYCEKILIIWHNKSNKFTIFILIKWWKLAHKAKQTLCACLRT